MLSEKECKVCHELKLVDAFRPQSRICKICKAAERSRKGAEKPNSLASRRAAIKAEGEGRTCKTCGVWKPFAEYIPKHARCRDCYNALRVAEVAGEVTHRAAEREAERQAAIALGGKVCKGCGIWKSFVDYQKAAGRSFDGTFNKCKTCRWEDEKVKRATDPKRNEGLKASYHRNKTKIYANKKVWYQANRETELAKDKAFYHANPEKMKTKRNRTYNAPGYLKRFSEWRKEYRKRKPHLVHLIDKVHSHKRAALKLGNGGSFTATEWLNICAQYDNRCLRCGRNDLPMTPDHILPLDLGGSSYIENIAPLCQPCNSSKGNKHIDYRPNAPYRGIELSVKIPKRK